MTIDSKIFHYPPEFLNLLINTIPLLFRSKEDLIIFFQGAGVNPSITKDIADIVKMNKDSISKYKIVRTILTRLNEMGDLGLEARREIVKQVTEFETFYTCWPDDQLKAKGLVSEVRRVVNVKDSFTQIKKELEQERKKRISEQEEKVKQMEKQRQELSAINKDLKLLFRETDNWKRGKALEGVLNRLFKANGILLREDITVKGNSSEGIIEQIDGVAEIDGELYLVEMKWWSKPLAPGDVSQHLVRVFNRGHARGIFISNSNYTDAAIISCKESLQRTVVVLCKLEEIVLLLEQERDLTTLLKQKIHAAIIHKNPFYTP